jgi:hypothetical protein
VVGEHLAILEMRIVAEEILRLVPDYQLADGYQPQWTPGRMTRGLSTMPGHLQLITGDTRKSQVWMPPGIHTASTRGDQRPTAPSAQAATAAW